VSAISRFTLRQLGELMLILGVVTGLFTAWLSWGQSPLPTPAQQQTNHKIQAAWLHPGTPIPGGALALVRIPALGKSWQYPVYQGTSLRVLGKGLGHYRGTAGPGQSGNFAFAGHRSSTSGFEPMAYLPNDIAVGDPVIIDTATAEYTYTVTATEYTAPDDVKVLQPDQGRGANPKRGLITITTCTPRYGSTGRFIVFGTLTRTVRTAPATGTAGKGTS
jgi:sortase A